ncbi:MAG: hypothetical protein K2X99_10810 [Gemmatimonadaceae bacterium]|nr:hypothetical protein [Gemmatimonadaceae bacterium]
MRRIVAVAFLVGLSACGEAAKPAAEGTPIAADSTSSAPPAPVALDTAPVDLSKMRANLPPAVADTVVRAPREAVVRGIPEAPAALMDAVEREEGISRFCYQEYGQKVDPQLAGGVAVVVTVAGGKVIAARIGADTWSSAAGRGVNGCLTQKAPQAWTLAPDKSIADGRYVVPLRFRPS